MKLNFNKIKLNQIVLVLALVVVTVWIVRRTRVRIELNEGAKSEALMYAESSIRIGAKVLWLQLGIKNENAKELVELNNIQYIENRCTKMEYQKAFLKINPAFPVLQD